MSAAVATIVSTTATSTTMAGEVEREQQACCPGVDEQQIEILTETWKQIDDEESKQRVGIVVFNRIFQLAPAAIAMFPKFKDVPLDELEEDENFLKHAYTVVDAVGLAVSFLDDLESLEEVLYDLGGKHIKYGVQKAHFEVVGQALIWALQKNFGDDFKPEVKAAWVAFYGFVSHHMGQGLSDAYDAMADADSETN